MGSRNPTPSTLNRRVPFSFYKGLIQEPKHHTEEGPTLGPGHRTQRGDPSTLLSLINPKARTAQTGVFKV